MVFWYNKALFDEFGYDIPETWEDYQALGDKLAAEHPGYILGSIGDPFTAVLTNMWSAQAPIYTVDGDTFTTDFSDDHTTRMIDLMDHMFANGTLAIDGLFTPDFPAKYKDKVLGIPGPTWFTGAIIQNPDILGCAGRHLGRRACRCTGTARTSPPATWVAACGTARATRRTSTRSASS